MVIFLIALSGAGKGNLLMRALGQRAGYVGRYAGVKEGGGEVLAISYYYFEDFEDSTADGWGIIDGNGDGVFFSVTPCTSIIQPPAGCGAYALNYSDDDAGGASPPAREVAISPLVPLPDTSSPLLLRYDYGYDSYAQDDTLRIYLLAVAPDSSVDTFMLDEIPLSSGGDSGTAYYDLDPYVGGAAGIRVAFSYVDAGGWNWNVALDNVGIGTPSPVVLFSEDFEDTAGVGWEVIDGNGDGVSFAITSCSAINQPPTRCGAFALNYDDDAAGESSPPANESAITPAVALPPGVPSVIVAYDYGFESYERDDTVGVYAFLYDASGGVDTVPIQVVRPGEPDSGRFMAFLSTSGVDSIRILFHYADAGGWNWNAAFDNISIIYAENDIAVLDVIPPRIPLYTFYPPDMAPSWPAPGDVGVVVMNTGTATASGFHVRLSLSGLPFSAPVGELESGSVDTVVFSGLSVDSVVRITATHDFLLDEVRENDTGEAVVDYRGMYRIASDTIAYSDTLVALDAVGTLGNMGPSRIAVRFDSSDVYLYSGLYIRRIFFYHCTPDASRCSGGGENAVALYPDAGGYPDHSNPLFRYVVGEVDSVPHLVVVELDSLSSADTSVLRIGYTYPFYVAREVENLELSFPFGVDGGPCWSGRGCWIQSDSLGPDWHLLTEYGAGMSTNWILGMVLGSAPVGGDEVVMIPADAELLVGVDDGYAYLSRPLDRDLSISIYNTAGRLVRHVLVRRGKRRVFLGRLPSGAYFYVAEDGKAGAFIIR